MATKIFRTKDSLCSYLNSWYLTPPYRGDLPNMPKHEFADLLFQYMDEAEKLEENEHLVVEFEDGRRLTFWYVCFHKDEVIGIPELREWSVQLYTLDQRTPRCLRKWKERKAWVYLAPYRGEGYKVRGKWAYKVWW
jgi:hypothetical protein